MKNIWFDMDGTIADLYGDKDWLTKLRAEDVTPYANAKPLLNMQKLARKLNALQAQGYNIGIISWLSKSGSAEYNAKVAQAKRKWLATHLASVKFNAIDIVEYGTPKQNGRVGILFDDEKTNRDAWGNGAHDATAILEVLKSL